MGTEVTVSAGSVEDIKKSTADQIESFKSTSDWYRRRYFLTSMSTLVLSVSITLLAGLTIPDGYQLLIKNLVLILSALNTLATGSGFFFSPKESWKITAHTLTKLKSLHHRISAHQQGALLAVPDATVFFAEYQNILDAHNAAWMNLRFKDSNDPTSPPKDG